MVVMSVRLYSWFWWTLCLIINKTFGYSVYLFKTLWYTIKFAGTRVPDDLEETGQNPAALVPLSQWALARGFWIDFAGYIDTSNLLVNVFPNLSWFLQWHSTMWQSNSSESFRASVDVFIATPDDLAQKDPALRLMNHPGQDYLISPCVWV